MRKMAIFMKCFFAILLLVNISSANASTLSNNIALASLGAQAYDNGNWVETAWPGTGYQYDAALAIDDINIGSSFWAGYGPGGTQQIWINFDQKYTIDSIYLDELQPGQASPGDGSWAFVTSGSLEYLNNGSWHHLYDISKGVPDLMLSFTPVNADGVRLNVYNASVPFSWANQNAECLYSFEVGGTPASPVPVPSAICLLGSALIALVAARRK